MSFSPPGHCSLCSPSLLYRLPVLTLHSLRQGGASGEEEEDLLLLLQQRLFRLRRSRLLRDMTTDRDGGSRRDESRINAAPLRTVD